VLAIIIIVDWYGRWPSAHPRVYKSQSLKLSSPVELFASAIAPCRFIPMANRARPSSCAICSNNFSTKLKETNSGNPHREVRHKLLQIIDGALYRRHAADHQRRDGYPGYGPIFKLVDNPRDPENVKRLEEARQSKRDNPNGLIIRHVIVSPPTGKPNWEGVSREERERWLGAYDRYDGLKNTFQEPKAGDYP
jgi:hypothetical protein